MENKLKKLFAEFTKKCEDEGFTPFIRLTLKPEIRDSVNPREQKIVDIIASNYITSEMYVKPLPANPKKDAKKSPEKGKKG